MVTLPVGLPLLVVLPLSQKKIAASGFFLLPIFPGALGPCKSIGAGGWRGCSCAAVDVHDVGCAELSKLTFRLPAPTLSPQRWVWCRSHP